MTLREDIAMVLEDAYWLGSDAAIGRCEDDSSMLIARGYTDRIMAHIDRLLAERGIDAMLDAVHPQARLNYLGYADFDLCWNAYLWTPDFVATTGTGPTRLEAIADACKRALEGRNDEL